MSEEIMDAPVNIKSEAIENRKNLEANMKNIWGHSELGIEAEKAAMTMLSTKTGMYARVPLRCKADECPYAESCNLLEYNLAPRGEFCPQETAMVKTNYVGYSDDFDIDNASFTDKNIVSTIIHYDVMIERVKSLIAKEGVPVVDVVAGIAENGEVFTRPEVSKHIEALEKFIKKRNELYQLMMGTRRDKKGEVTTEDSLSTILSRATTGDFVIDTKPENIK